MIGPEALLKLCAAVAPLLAVGFSPGSARGEQRSSRQNTRSQPGPELSLGLGWGDPHP
jgi:hypothetical protein